MHGCFTNRVAKALSALSRVVDYLDGMLRPSSEKNGDAYGSKSEVSIYVSQTLVFANRPDF